MIAPTKQLLVLACAAVLGCGQQLVEFPNPGGAPTVVSTIPAAAVINATADQQISATFSEAMAPATINATTFTVSQGTNPISGAVAYSGLTATFQPANPLAPGTVFFARITTGAQSAASGAGLASDYTWSFATAAASTNPVTPSVLATSPANNATGVAVNASVSATFNVAMNAATINATTFSLQQGSTPVTGVVTYAGTTATFTPAANLAASTVYTATITTGAESAATNTGLASNFVWSFTTASTVSPVTPSVIATSPANSAMNVAVSTPLTATFSVAMDPSTIAATTFLLKLGAAAVTGAVSYAGTTATFTPAASLVAGSSYTATITTGAKSAAGVALAANYVWTFTTANAVAVVNPAVTVVDPSNNAIGVALNKVINAAFNEAMDCTSLTATTFLLSNGAAPVTGAVACNNAAATFTPGANLLASTTYTATIKGGANGVKDPSGHAMAADYVWSFTTVDTTAPQIIAVNPNDGATNVCPNVVVTASFDSAMNANTINSLSFTLSAPTGPVSGVVSYDAAMHVASFTPSSNLATSTAFVATVTNAVKDENGNPLAQDKVWRFSTGNSLCQAPINLQSLSSFVAVAGAGLTNSDSGGTTVLNGDVGLYPSATCMGDGSPCTALDPVINGTLYANDPAGVAAAAKADLTNAYNDAAGRPPGVTVADLSGMTLAPGVYSSGSTMSIAVGGTLILDAQGNSNGVWIFQIGSSLTVNDNARVLLVNGAKAGNVYWAIFASSTIGGNVEFKGNVLAGASNSVGTGSMIEGRLLCRTGQITLLSDTVTLPTP